MGCGCTTIIEIPPEPIDDLILKKNNVVSVYFDNDKIPNDGTVNDMNSIDLEITERLNSLKKRMNNSNCRRMHGKDYFVRVKRKIRELNIKWKGILTKYMNAKKEKDSENVSDSEESYISKNIKIEAIQVINLIKQVNIEGNRSDKEKEKNYGGLVNLISFDFGDKIERNGGLLSLLNTSQDFTCE